MTGRREPPGPRRSSTARSRAASRREGSRQLHHQPVGFVAGEPMGLCQEPGDLAAAHPFGQELAGPLHRLVGAVGRRRPASRCLRPRSSAPHGEGIPNNNPPAPQGPGAELLMHLGQLPGDHRLPRRARPAASGRVSSADQPGGRLEQDDAPLLRRRTLEQPGSLPAFPGEKPRKRYRSPGSPAAESAVATAEGPGMGTTVMARLARGGDQVGPRVADHRRSGVRDEGDVPVVSPGSRAASPAGAPWEWAWKLRTVGVAPRCESSPRVRRVSSAATTGTDRRISAARGERSPRLPRGVATT